MQLNSLAYWLQSVSNMPLFTTIRRILVPVYDRMTSVILKSGGAIVIVGAGNTAAKTGAAITYGIANGVIRTIAAATTLGTLSGTVTNARFNVYAWFVDAAGALTALMGTEGVALANVKFPQFPVGKACIGFVIINPTGTGPFIGGTTPLDDATVVPNAVYVDVTEGFDPFCLIGGQLTNS